MPRVAELMFYPKALGVGLTYWGQPLVESPALANSMKLLSSNPSMYHSFQESYSTSNNQREKKKRLN